MKYPIMCLIALVACVSLSGCPSKSIYRDAAESGWENWEQDHKEVVPTDEYIEMSDEDQATHMSQTLYDARLFEKEQALRLLED